MRNRIFMYLFIFALLVIIFQFFNSRKILDDYEQKIVNSEQKEEIYEDSIQSLEDANFELMRFQLEFNDDAMTKLENRGYEISEIVPFIKDELIKLNIYEGDDHPIVPYASMTGNKMMINEVKLLNDKWIIANFSDGKNWGEMLLQFEIRETEEKDELVFNLLDYNYYPSSRN
ncbi:MAG: hydrolase [Flavobacteriaceae bacterium]|nr:hydrolase [Flavobacteriaceae bacterium]